MHAAAEKISVKHCKWCSVGFVPRLHARESLRTKLGVLCSSHAHYICIEHRLELEPDRLIAWYAFMCDYKIIVMPCIVCAHIPVRTLLRIF